MPATRPGNTCAWLEAYISPCVDAAPQQVLDLLSEMLTIFQILPQVPLACHCSPLLATVHVGKGQCLFLLLVTSTECP